MEEEESEEEVGKGSKINIDKYLEDIEEEDIELVKQQEGQDAQDIKKGKDVNNQLGGFKMALNLRMEIRKMQDIVKKLPLHTTAGEF